MTDSTPDVVLPNVLPRSLEMARSIAHSLGVVPHSQVSEQDIQNVWEVLQTLVTVLPAEARTATLVRLCAVASVGAFDAAISYGWNIAISGLRSRFDSTFDQRFPNVMLRMEFSRRQLRESDKRFLSSCNRLDLLSDESHQTLDDCREIRNSRSAAHPVSEPPGASELLEFLSSTWTSVFRTSPGRLARDSKYLLNLLHGDLMDSDEIGRLCSNVRKLTAVGTAMAMRLLHGIYCESDQDSIAKMNVANLCRPSAWDLPSSTVDGLIRQHVEYQHDLQRKAGARKYPRHATGASRHFFKSLVGLGAYLPCAPEQLCLLRMCDDLMRAHADRWNFRYEPLIAQQLDGLTDGTVEKSAPIRYRYVAAVATCAVGHERGVARDAQELYHKMVSQFSEPEIEILLSLPRSDGVVGHRLRKIERCRREFSTVIRSLDQSLVSRGLLEEYRKWASAQP